MIEDQTTLDGMTADRLRGGFFAGWPDPPTPETHLRLLQGSTHVVLAIDVSSADVVGFITAVSDGVLAAYIPLLEVLSNHQSLGIGAELVTRMLEQLSGSYMIDLLCDAPLQDWYGRFGLRRAHGMMARNYENQQGRSGATRH